MAAPTNHGKAHTVPPGFAQMVRLVTLDCAIKVAWSLQRIRADLIATGDEAIVHGAVLEQETADGV